jgi:DNA-directed RNA polymerase specialized sigma24 family protein
MSGTAQVRVPAGSWPSGRAAVTELFGLHYRRLVGLATLLVDDRETAEDVAQDAFEALYRHWGRLRDPQAAAGYLERCVVNGSRSRLRRRGTERSYELPEAGQEPSRRQREVMVLRYYLDLSEQQIADWLGISRGSVKRHAARAAAALHQQMEAWT